MRFEFGEQLKLCCEKSFRLGRRQEALELWTAVARAGGLDGDAQPRNPRDTMELRTCRA